MERAVELARQAAEEGEVPVGAVIVRDGEIVVAPIMYVALSYDHRIIDGRESVGFLVAVKEALESPEELLMDGDVKKALEL